MLQNGSLIIAILLIMSTVFDGHSQSTLVDWYSVNSGYNESVNQKTMLRSVVGQPVTSSVTNQQSKCGIGFLYNRLFTTSILEHNAELQGYDLEAFPNPFKDVINVHFHLDKPAHVSISIYDIFGRKLGLLIENEFATGTFSFNLDMYEYIDQNTYTGMYLLRSELHYAKQSFTSYYKMMRIN